MKSKTLMFVGAALATLMLAPAGAQADQAADNEENCLRTAGYIVIFSGTDAGAARRGLNAGTAGCNTAGDPDVPFVDTNYITPGSTHGIVGITGLGAGVNPGSATWTFGDDSIELNLTYVEANSRWESQSIPMPSGTGTISISVPNYGAAHYQKLV